MLLVELFDEEPQKVTGRLTDDELGLAYEKLRQNEMSKEEIHDWSRQQVEDGRYPRSPESLKFVLSRMHIILHGVAPEGESPNRADVMFRDTQPIINFVLSKGELDEEDIQMHIGHAREELAQRQPPKAKLKREDALRMMADYYKEHRDILPNNIAKFRDQIVNSILGGMTPDQAFSAVA